MHSLSQFAADSICNLVKKAAWHRNLNRDVLVLLKVNLQFNPVSCVGIVLFLRLASIGKSTESTHLLQAFAKYLTKNGSISLLFR